MKTLKFMLMLFIASALCFGFTSCGDDDDDDDPTPVENNDDNEGNKPTPAETTDFSKVIPGHWQNADASEYDNFYVSLSINYNGPGTICLYDFINDLNQDLQYGVMAFGTYTLNGNKIKATYNNVEVKDADWKPFSYHGFSDGKNKSVEYTIVSCDGEYLVLKDDSGKTTKFEKYGDVK